MNSSFVYYTTIMETLQTLIIGGGGLATAILAMWGIWSKILCVSAHRQRSK